MAELINLRIARKQKKRADKNQLAAQNCRAYGQSAKTKESQKFELEIQARKLDGHKRNPVRARDE